MNATFFIKDSSIFPEAMKPDNTNHLQLLINGCKAGERSAQQMLYNQFSSKMYAICLRYTKDQMHAEDVLQLSFVKIFTKMSSFKSDGSLEGWIKKIVINTAIEQYRKNLRFQSMVSIDDHEMQITDESMFDSLQLKDLLKMINTLSDGYRMIFNMYVIEGFSHKEIAKMLGISESGSKSQLSRARHLLQAQIFKREGQVYDRK